MSETHLTAEGRERGTDGEEGFARPWAKEERERERGKKERTEGRKHARPVNRSIGLSFSRSITAAEEDPNRQTGAPRGEAIPRSDKEGRSHVRERVDRHRRRETEDRGADCGNEIDPLDQTRAKPGANRFCHPVRKHVCAFGVGRTSP